MLAKFSLTFAALLVLFVSANSQQPCKKSIAEAPAIFGLRLGMSFDEVQSALGPAIKMKPKKNGEGGFFENFIDAPAPSNLAGLKALFIRFYNSKVYRIEIFYDDKDQTTRLDDFTKQLADLGLPADAWTIKHDRAEMDCGDFVIKADTFLNRHLELTDDAASTEFDKKQQQAKAAKKKS